MTQEQKVDLDMKKSNSQPFKSKASFAKIEVDIDEEDEEEKVEAQPDDVDELNNRGTFHLKTNKLEDNDEINDNRRKSKFQRMVSFQPNKVPIPKETKPQQAQNGSTKAMKLFKMVTMKAIKDLSTNKKDGMMLTQPKPSTSLFHKSFQQFKSKMIDNPDDFAHLKPNVKEKINKIIDIEQSIAFRASRHIMNRLDIFSRFFFPIVFSSWFNFTLFFLDYDIGKFKKIINFKLLQSHEIC